MIHKGENEMNQAQLIEKIAISTKLPKVQIRNILGSTIDTIKKEVKKWL